MTSSPTRLISRSTRSRSTRIVWGVVWGAAPAPAAASLRAAFGLAGAAAVSAWSLGVHGGGGRDRLGGGEGARLVVGLDRADQGEDIVVGDAARGIRGLDLQAAIPFDELEDLADGVLVLVGRQPDRPGEIGAFRIELAEMRQLAGVAADLDLAEALEFAQHQAVSLPLA